MQITANSTARILEKSADLMRVDAIELVRNGEVELRTFNCPVRLWEGVTPEGHKVRMYVVRLEVDEDPTLDNAALQADLESSPAPVDIDTKLRRVYV